MAMRDRKVTQQFDGMGCSMAQVEQFALPRLTLVGLYHVALDGHAAFHNTTFLARKGALQPLKELGVTHDTVFHDLAHAVAHKLARQGLETAQLADDKTGLVECADEVLSLGQVNGGLSTHAGVNHGKQRGGHLDEVAAAHIAGRSEARQVADDAAAQSDDGAAARES